MFELWLLNLFSSNLLSILYLLGTAIAWYLSPFVSWELCLATVRLVAPKTGWTEMCVVLHLQPGSYKHSLSRILLMCIQVEDSLMPTYSWTQDQSKAAASFFWLSCIQLFLGVKSSPLVFYLLELDNMC